MTRPSTGASVRRGVRDLRAAAVFLTRLPLTWPDGAPADQLGRATVFFPLVGAGVGAVAGLIAAGLAWAGAVPWLAAAAALAVQIALTGALHEDGLADLADGVGGGRTRDRKLEIMRDSRTGAYGVLALVLSVVLRTAALAGLIGAAGPWSPPIALATAGAVSRGTMVALFAALPPARRDGVAATNRPSTGQATAAVAWASALACALLIAPLGPVAGLAGSLAALCMAAIAAAAIGWLAYRSLGGHTGDVLGAAQQVAEISILAILSILAAGVA